MAPIPKIVVQQNQDEEIKLFLSFLHHPYYQRKRDDILRTFSDLQEKLNTVNDEKQAVAEFVSKYYKEHEGQISAIIETTKQLFEQKSASALKTVAELMQYTWQADITYYAIPTILPFSPFHGNTFFFSILGELKGKMQKDKNVLSVAIHEISHFIFFDQIKKLTANKEIPEPPKETLDFIKEAVTAFMLNEEPLKTILGIEGYTGNPELKELFVEAKDRKEPLVSHLQNLYHAKQQKGGDFFVDFVKETMMTFIPLNAEFIEKRRLWNKLGSSGKTDADKLEYAEPIRIA